MGAIFFFFFFFASGWGGGGVGYWPFADIVLGVKTDLFSGLLKFAICFGVL